MSNRSASPRRTGAVRSATRRCKGFAPVIDEHVRVLVLGSFPSSTSLAAHQYYGHARNQFWRILGAILGEPLQDLEYGERLRCVLAHRVGIWDVYADCRRSGSLDSQIHAPRPNDLGLLAQLAPGLRAVACNGQAAGRVRRSVLELGYACEVLPSTSPAHAARRIEDKLAVWQAFFRVWC
ncbi:MAG: DNA-deoxyinosine glycosylase [Burkholderiaceae bacterium]|nr:DNA-deoxyinosine glycosylase [Burkholderiaceae bacterium]